MFRKRTNRSRPLRAPGATLLLLSTLVASAAGGLAWPTGNAILCERLPPLAVLAALAAALIALCFRTLSRTPARLLLGAALLLAMLAFFLSARFVAHTYSACQAVQQQLRRQHLGP